MSLEKQHETIKNNNESKEKALEGFKKELEALENNIDGPKRIIKKVVGRFFKDYEESLQNIGFSTLAELQEAIENKQESKIQKHPELKTFYENILYITKQKGNVRKNLLTLMEMYGLETEDEKIFEPSVEEIENNPDLATPTGPENLNSNPSVSPGTAEKFSESAIAESIGPDGKAKPLRSSPYERNPNTGITLCGQTGFENAKQLGMEAESNHAHLLAFNYRSLLSQKFPNYEVTTWKNGNIGSKKVIEKIKTPQSKTLQYVMTCGTQNPFKIEDIPAECNTLDIHGKFPGDQKIYGHRISAFKGSDGKRRVFDVYNGTFGRTRKPIPLEDYLKRGRLTFTTVAMHKSDLTFNVKTNKEPNKEISEKLNGEVEKKEFYLGEYGKVEALIPKDRNGETEIYLPGDRSSIESWNNAKGREKSSAKKSSKDKKARIIVEGNAQYIRTNGKDRYNSLVKENGFITMTEELKKKIGAIKDITLIGHSRGGIAVNQILADTNTHNIISKIVSLDGTYIMPTENMKTFLQKDKKKAEIIYIPNSPTQAGALALSGRDNVKLIPSTLSHEQIATHYISPFTII